MSTQEYVFSTIGTASISNFIDPFDSLYKGFISTGNWAASTVSGIDSDYLDLYDQTLYNNLGIISNNLGLNRIKDYEIEFEKSSSDFYSLWNEGKFPINQKTFDWAGMYKSLFLETTK